MFLLMLCWDVQTLVLIDIVLFLICLLHFCVILFHNEKELVLFFASFMSVYRKSLFDVELQFLI